MKVIICLMGIVTFAQCIAMESEESGTDGSSTLVLDLNGSRGAKSSFDIYSPYKPEVTDQNRFNGMNVDDKWEQFNTLNNAYENIIDQAKKDLLESEREIHQLKKENYQLKKQSFQRALKVAGVTIFFTISGLTLLQKMYGLGINNE